MIKYMVIVYDKNAYDEWVSIKHSDISDIREAEAFREAILANTTRIAPENIHVVQYKE